MAQNEGPEINVALACAILRDAGFRASPDKLRAGLAQGVYPFGDYIAADGCHLKNDCYTVYTKKLTDWIRERETTA